MFIFTVMFRNLSAFCSFYGLFDRWWLSIHRLEDVERRMWVRTSVVWPLKQPHGSRTTTKHIRGKGETSVATRLLRRCGLSYCCDDLCMFNVYRTRANPADMLQHQCSRCRRTSGHPGFIHMPVWIDKKCETEATKMLDQRPEMRLDRLPARADRWSHCQSEGLQTCTGIWRRDFQSGEAVLRQQIIHTHITVLKSFWGHSKG